MQHGRERKMIKTYLKCEICGSEWNISDTPYARTINPGARYLNDCVFNGRRNWGINKMVPASDERIEFENMDICDGCWIAIDKFIYRLKNKEENDG